jgi:DNA-binding MarR family transcriptional regulator
MGMTPTLGPRLAPSTRLIIKVLEENGWMTQKEIVDKTNLPPRTVKYAIKQMKSNQILEEKPNWDDLRSKLLRLNPRSRRTEKLF